MVRIPFAVLVIVGCASCRPGPPTDPLGRSSRPLVEPTGAVKTPAPRSPDKLLRARHHAAVTIERAVKIAGGTVVAYAFDRIESRIGERAAAGHDTKTELSDARRLCQQERAALDPEEREWLESEYPSCHEQAAALLLEDDQLTPGCRSLGVAYFDASGELVDDIEPNAACLVSIGSLEAYPLTPRPEPELMLVSTHETFGALTRGGWGQTERVTLLTVLATPPAGASEGPALVEQLEVELGITHEGGNCSGGIRRSARVASVGTIEVFSQAWSDCDDEGCIDPDAEDAAVFDPSQLCPRDPVTAERITWQAELGRWGPPEPRVYEGDVLPDGLM